MAPGHKKQKKMAGLVCVSQGALNKTIPAFSRP
jgi:hypothetical protein